MANLYSCPVCGNTGLKQNGARYTCQFCKNAFGEAELTASQNPGSGSSGAQSGAPVVSTPVSNYVGAMFGNAPTPPPGNGGFMAPPDSLIQSIAEANRRKAEAEAAALRQNTSGSSSSGGGRKREGSSNNGSSSSSNSSSSSSNSNLNNGSSGGSSSGASSNSNSGSSGGSNSSSSNSNGSSSSNSNSSSSNGSTPSDSENNVKFLDNVSLMNDLAYELVNGNANAWANIARDKGIINSKQHTEIKYIVATRNCIAHGSGDTVRITAELVKSARDYYELMRRTASQIR